MADYEVKSPPNLRSVDCCATCVHVVGGIDEQPECTRFKMRGADSLSGWQRINTPVTQFDICDAFEREVRAT